MDLDELPKGKEILKAENRHQILGIQAQLFTETIRGFDWVEYYVFPKLFGLVERGWNAHPVWEKMRGDEEQKAFTEDLAHFYTLISDREMPYLNHLKINFRLGNPGLNVHEDMLYANTTVRGATIHYTTDGREPTFSSPIWTSPVKCEGATTFKACIYYLGKKSLTTTLITQK